jgi:hypothetical protein
MPSFVKSPKFIISTLVVLWVLYIIYANFQVDTVKFYLLPFGVLTLQLKLSAIVIGSALFGAAALFAIQYFWRRGSSNPSVSSSATVSVAPSSKTTA